MRTLKRRPSLCVPGRIAFGEPVGKNATESFGDGSDLPGRKLDYRIDYSPAAEEHLPELKARQRSMVFDAVDEQLGHQPTVETRNRKPMRPNPLARWELRIGDLRV